MSGTEETELGLVSKVELRFALADSDTKLESLLNTYLAPLLLKLASEHASVRSKVIAITQHINARIKTPSLQLPVETLIKQFKDPHSTSSMRQFDLVYISQGLPRLEKSKSILLLPLLFHGISKDFERSQAQSATILNLFFRLLPLFPIPERGSDADTALLEKLGIQDQALDVSFVAFWVGRLLLFVPQRPDDNNASNANPSNMRNLGGPVRPPPLNNSSDGPSGPPTSPGLSPKDYDFLTAGKGAQAWNVDNPFGLNLPQTKVTAVKFLASAVFSDHQRTLPALIASADTNTVIATLGDEIVKRSSLSTSLEDAFFLEDLFELYFGTANGTRPPVKLALKIKIVGLFTKSVKVVDFPESVCRLIGEGLESDQVRHGPRDGMKLRNAVMAFTTWIARTENSQKLQEIAPRVFKRLRRFIYNMGWPRPYREEETFDPSLRGFAYECIGLFARARPEQLLLNDDFKLLSWFFQSLAMDPTSNISVSIEEGLGSVLQGLSQSIKEEHRPRLRQLLSTHIDLQVGDRNPFGNNTFLYRSTRFAAVRFANRCLTYNDAEARWIDLQAVGSHPDERHEVFEEGKKGLDPHWFRMTNLTSSSQSSHIDETDPQFALPKFPDLMLFFLRQIAPNVRVDSSCYERSSFLNLHSQIYNPMVSFLRSVLIAHLLRESKYALPIDSDWERSIAHAPFQDKDARNFLRESLIKLAKDDEEFLVTFRAFLNVCFVGFTTYAGPLTDESRSCFVEMASLCNDDIIAPFASRAPLLEDGLSSFAIKIREQTSRAFGILGSHPDSVLAPNDQLLEDFKNQLQHWDSAKGAAINQCHGTLLALVSLITRLHCRRSFEQLSSSTAFLLKHILNIMMKSRDSTLLTAASATLGQLALFGTFSLNEIPEPNSVEGVVAHLSKLAKKGNEQAISCLGRLAMICPESSTGSRSLKTTFIKPLLELYDIKQSETQLTVGEALSCATMGWKSRSLMTTLDVDAGIPSTASRTSAFQDLIDEILIMSKNTKPSIRKASCIWLFSQITLFEESDAVQERLRSCQAAFKRFLSDRDDFVQECAARGLGLVYERGDKQVRDELVRDLAASFTDTNNTLGGNVNPETELFEPGALPTGDGSVSTYKDIMSLASELGDPSLVYRFMSLAANNAAWSNRAAFGRFGLGNILSGSGYLARNPKLYAKLYRYKFDPNSNVQRSMNDIWNALVEDSNAVLNEYFDSIIEDLLKSILGKEWRVRQASCSAISELIQGRRLEKYERHLNDIWTAAFKVLDDIKSSVRLAAMNLCQSLTGMLVRAVEAGSVKKAEPMLKNVIPFLMSPSGIEASAKEVQMFALDTVLKLAKTGTKSLRPHVPTLVEKLLGLLSTLEPEAVNYVHLNAAKYNIEQSKIDEERLRSVRGSPVMDALERCLDILDEQSMMRLVPALENAIIEAVGLPSKVGCSRILVSLSTRHNFLFKPYVGPVFRLVQKHLLDRNETVASSWASAAGYLARLAFDKDILSACTYARHLYFDSEDDKHRIVSGELTLAISKYASDRFAALASDFLPFVYIAQHDSNPAVKDSFKSAWDENVGGSRSIVLYQSEILDLASSHLQSPRWVVKHASAYSVGGVISAISDKASLQQQEKLWSVLVEAVGGKSWDGKERVVESFVKFAKQSRALQESKPGVADEMRKIILRESKRNNPSFRQHTIASLGQFVEDWPEDMVKDVVDVVTPIFDSLKDHDEEMDVDSGVNGSSSRAIAETTISNSIISLSQAFVPSRNILTSDGITFVAFLLDVTKATTSRRVRRIGLARYEALSRLARVLQAKQNQEQLAEQLNESQSGAAVSTVITGLVNNLEQSAWAEACSAEERLKRAEAALDVARIVSLDAVKAALPEPATLLVQILRRERVGERDQAIQSKLDSAIALLP